MCAQEWIDQRLKWDPKDYNNLATMRIPCQRIWLPDIVLYNRWEWEFYFIYKGSATAPMTDGDRG